MAQSVQRTQIRDEILFEEPVKRLLPELESLTPDEVEEVNLDGPTAVATAFGVLPQLQTYRDSIAKELPVFDLARFDKLEDYALALSHTNAVHATATRPVNGLVEPGGGSGNCRHTKARIHAVHSRLRRRAARDSFPALA